MIILVHGSGSPGMDVDLTMATRGQKKNLVFKATSDALLKEGFADDRLLATGDDEARWEPR